jgi:DNA-binding transcriptional MerR regulator
MAKQRKPIEFGGKRLYHSIHEVADHFAVNISLLRYWEKEFDNINPRKTRGGTRQFTKEDVAQIAIVYRLVKEKGLTLEGAKRALKTNKTDEDNRMEALSRLQDIKKELTQLEEEFDTLHEHQKYTNTTTKE